MVTPGTFGRKSSEKLSWICFSNNFLDARCLKITEKVSFNIASVASSAYILRGQKFINFVENGQFWRALENLKFAVKQCYQTFWVDKSSSKCQKYSFSEFLKAWSLLSNSVTRQVNFNRPKLMENDKLSNFEWDILGDFETLWVKFTCKNPLDSKSFHVWQNSFYLIWFHNHHKSHICHAKIHPLEKSNTRHR